MNRTVTFAAIQPLSAKAWRVRALKDNPEKSNEHFLKYNIRSSTYDAAYCREYGEEYLESYLGNWIRKAAQKGANLALLPEFVFMPGVIGEPLPEVGENRNYLRDAIELYRWSSEYFISQAGKLARENGLFIAGALPTVEKDQIFNTCMIISDQGKLIEIYHKIHLPLDEKKAFSAGDGFRVVKTKLGRIGFAICYDIQFPEHCACLARMGAQVILHPSAGYTLPDETGDMGMNRLRVRASDSFCALIYASFAPEKVNSPRNSCVIAADGDVLDVVRGKRTGIAVGKTVTGRKRSWPADNTNSPDREKIRRQCRRPETYSLLARMGSGLKGDFDCNRL